MSPAVPRELTATKVLGTELGDRGRHLLERLRAPGPPRPRDRRSHQRDEACEPGRMPIAPHPPIRDQARVPLDLAAAHPTDPAPSGDEAPARPHEPVLAGDPDAPREAGPPAERLLDALGPRAHRTRNRLPSRSSRRRRGDGPAARLTAGEHPSLATSRDRRRPLQIGESLSAHRSLLMVTGNYTSLPPTSRTAGNGPARTCPRAPVPPRRTMGLGGEPGQNAPEGSMDDHGRPMGAEDEGSIVIRGWFP